jgi:hypothetical protein
MTLSKSFALVLVSLWIVTLSRAETPTPADATPSPAVRDRRWTLGLNLGTGPISYGGDVKNYIAADTARDNASRNGPVYFETFFGWRLRNGKSVIGPSLSFYSDTYSSKTAGDFNATTIFGSFMYQHFLEAHSHDGLFFRADVGIADTSMHDPHRTFNTAEQDFVGLGLRLAAGFAIPLGKGFTAPLMASWQSTSGQNDSTANAFLVTAGLQY